MCCEDNKEQNQCPQEIPNHPHFYKFLTTPSGISLEVFLSHTVPAPPPPWPVTLGLVPVSELRICFPCVTQALLSAVMFSACFSGVCEDTDECICHSIRLDLKYNRDAVSRGYWVGNTYQYHFSIIFHHFPFSALLKPQSQWHTKTLSSSVTTFYKKILLDWQTEGLKGGFGENSEDG